MPEVYEHGTDGRYFYIAMEYLDGQNLSEVIAGGPLPPARASAIAIQLCQFLEAAHRFEATIDGRQLRSLLHGDLKPRNIRVLDGDEIKVLDFGIAKALSLSRKVTRNDFGSIAYLSPERLDSGEIDAHADFWAVGVLLYEMVGGVQPFQAPDTRRLEQRIRSRRAPPAPLDGGCPVGLQAIVAKLLRRLAADRYGNAHGDSRRSRALRGRARRRRPSAKAGRSRGTTSRRRGARVRAAGDDDGSGDAPDAQPASPARAPSPASPPRGRQRRARSGAAAAQTVARRSRRIRFRAALRATVAAAGARHRRQRASVCSSRGALAANVPTLELERARRDLGAVRRAERAAACGIGVIRPRARAVQQTRRWPTRDRQLPDAVADGPGGAVETAREALAARWRRAGRPRSCGRRCATARAICTASTAKRARRGSRPPRRSTNSRMRHRVSRSGRAAAELARSRSSA